MADFALEECASGENEDAYWVSLGFSSAEEEQDSLHVECGKAADPYPGFQGLYFERTDQGMSGYDLAASVDVFEDRVEVCLNSRGVQVLRLPSDLHFDAAAVLADWAEVVATFHEMAVTPNGGVLRFLK